MPSKDVLLLLFISSFFSSCPFPPLSLAYYPFLDFRPLFFVFILVLLLLFVFVLILFLIFLLFFVLILVLFLCCCCCCCFCLKFRANSRLNLALASFSSFLKPACKTLYFHQSYLCFPEDLEQTLVSERFYVKMGITFYCRWSLWIFNNALEFLPRIIITPLFKEHPKLNSASRYFSSFVL